MGTCSAHALLLIDAYMWPVNVLFVSTIHLFSLSPLQKYYEAGADFAETNTFNGTSVSQGDYGTEHLVRDYHSLTLKCNLNFFSCN